METHHQKKAKNNFSIFRVLFGSTGKIAVGSDGNQLNWLGFGLVVDSMKVFQVGNHSILCVMNPNIKLSFRI